MGNNLNPVELDFLLRFPAVPNLTTPVDFLNNNSWGGIKVLILKDFNVCLLSFLSLQIRQTVLRRYVKTDMSVCAYLRLSLISQDLDEIS